MANLINMKKSEIVKMSNFRCEHGHSGIEHQSCYTVSHGERIGFVDIECNHLKSNWGIILSYCIWDGKKMYSRVITPKEIGDKKTYDKNLCKQFIEDVGNFDRLIGYYSSRFDLPFLRTRCVGWGLHFPEFGTLKTKDLYDIIKHKFNFHSNRLQVACEFFKIPSKGHKLNPTVWLDALTGDKKALNFILTHNKEDVVSTKLLWDKVNPYAKITDTSI